MYPSNLRLRWLIDAAGLAEHVATANGCKGNGCEYQSFSTEAGATHSARNPLMMATGGSPRSAVKWPHPARSWKRIEPAEY